MGTKIIAPYKMRLHGAALDLNPGENDVDFKSMHGGTHRHIAHLVEHGVLSLPEGEKLPKPPTPEEDPPPPPDETTCAECGRNRFGHVILPCLNHFVLQGHNPGDYETFAASVRASHPEELGHVPTAPAPAAPASSEKYTLDDSEFPPANEAEPEPEPAPPHEAAAKKPRKHR